MRLFLYYFLHTFKNQIRKLFKTWVAIFILACIVLGGLIGFSAGVLFGTDNDTAPEQEEEILPDEAQEILPQPDEPGFAHEEVAEAAAAVVVLLVFIIGAVPSESNGKKLFTMADVNLLFSAPMKPQSVLMFKLITRMGVSAGISLYYVLFQIPNLIHNVGLSMASVWLLLAVWIMALVFSRLLSVLVYTLCTSHPKARQTVKYILYGVAAALVLGFVLFWRRGGEKPLVAAVHYLSTPWMRYIPVWGWLKAAAGYAVSGAYSMCIPIFAVLLAAAAVLVLIIWRMPADFYETAMASSQEMAEFIQSAQEKGNLFASNRKKDRSETIRRDGFNRGSGGNVYYYKTLYNRFRFGKLHYFTGTSITYTVAAVLGAVLLRFVFKSQLLLPVLLLLAFLAFFRALGDPLAQDTKTDLFFMLPEPPFRRVFFSLLGGAVNCLLDLIPGVAIACIILGGDVVTALLGLALITAVELYATSVGAFISLAVPSSIAQNIRNAVQIFFIYFGLLPLAAILAVFIVQHLYITGTVVTIAFSLAITVLFTALTGSIMSKGRK